ncbi:splicing factor 3B subunit 2, putative [Eimeria acervulina]|uniref:Splicing factor 3B subunit 2, putative n=1 Tax=Eimeria acervulina TaxID=5801 RepID=U6G7A2_EIMAC|nr:splicing factor 3B subunit 2, putative [Eimeria acervulina]CDI76121.1 splicing factor 3B subunit 2, putative [Eimeria acervulina]
MAPPLAATVGGSSPSEGGEGNGEAAAGAAAAAATTAAAGGAAAAAATAAVPNGKSMLHDLWKKNGAKAKRVVKLLRRKRQKQQKRQQQQQQQDEQQEQQQQQGGSAELTKEELLAAVPLRSKQRDLLLPVGRNKKLKKKLEALLGVTAEEAETESEEEEDKEDEEEAEADSDQEDLLQDGAAAADKQQQQQQEDIEVIFLPPKEAEGADGLVAQLAESFNDVFEKFGANLRPEEQEEEDEEEEEEDLCGRGEVMGLEEEDSDEEAAGSSSSSSSSSKKGTAGGGAKVPRGQLRRMQRPTVCSLKQHTARPDRIEVWDTTGSDPFFLAFLKGLRNVVSVPQHWSQKRRYLQWKRGFEKPPFKLPPHIEATKISEVRSALVEAEKQKTMRQRMREKVRPKANRLTIDYQVLHDCFFKHAVKPPLTKLGDLYYEGKEFQQAKRNIKPGVLYGPPPAYPRLRLPGLNAPIPAGCSYGYQPGGWGRPPVDEGGRLLFRLDEETDEAEETAELQQDAPDAANDVLWGELPPDADAPQEEEEEQGLCLRLCASLCLFVASEGEAAAGEGAQLSADTPFAAGAASVGLSSIGLSSPASVSLMQQKGGSSSVSSSSKAYTVLTPQETTVQQGQLFGVKHTYRIPAAALSRQQQQQQQQPGSGLASGVQTPAGVSTPRLLSGRASPFIPGVASPFVGSAAAASGASTPLVAAARAGAATPIGVTVSLNPNEMEQEGAFTADVIRQQLRQHEEAAARAKAAAGQIDPADHVSLG